MAIKIIGLDAAKKAVQEHSGIKRVSLGNGETLHFWYANNKGRGSNNCTIILSETWKRATRSAEQTNVLAKTTTSAWAGKVNFSQHVQKKLGLV